MSKNLVIVFVKEPKKGFVKTRLSKSIGENITLEIYKRFVKDIVSTLKSTDVDFKLCGYPTLELINNSFGDFDNFLQVEGNLGRKMCSAFEEQFSKGYEKIILIGSDTPNISKEQYKETFKALDKNDIVLGPSEDGGYYLIAFNSSTFYKNVFNNILWSTDQVLKQTLQTLNNKAVYLLKELNDIDTISDLNNFFEQNKKNHFKDSFTIEFLRGDLSWKNTT